MSDWRAPRNGEMSTRRNEKRKRKDKKLTNRNGAPVAGNQNFMIGATFN